MGYKRAEDRQIRPASPALITTKLDPNEAADATAKMMPLVSSVGAIEEPATVSFESLFRFPPLPMRVGPMTTKKPPNPIAKLRSSPKSAIARTIAKKGVMVVMTEVREAPIASTAQL